MKQLEAQKSKEMAEKMMIYGAQNKAKPVLKEKLLDLFEEFWSEKSRLVRSMQTYHALRHCIMRYEGYKGICFRVDMLTKEWVMNFEEYMNREWKILSERPDLANLCPSQRNVKPRGLNTIAKQMKSLSVFCNWLVLNKYLAHNPLLLYHKPAQVSTTEKRPMRLSPVFLMWSQYFLLKTVPRSSAAPTRS